ncbi:hypothetical protein [Rhodopirellula europaea]|uniref:hypothetical protein n=1 Tax=Rhodopirellula europaea TaxID=1263866 RepID=UPI001181AC2E|nr:hypothetical protein [Rhodopirellula europaea]
MANALTLDAPPAMFDDFASILDNSDFDCTLSSSDSIERGIRRMDTASYEVTHGAASVHLAMERRLGNPTMFIAIMPAGKTLLRRDEASNRLAEQIVKLLVANGADDAP